MKPKTRKILLNLSIIIGSILLIVGTYLATYTYFLNYSVNSYVNVIERYTHDINAINESTYSLIKGETIDDKNTKNELENKINKLSKIKKYVDKLIPSEKYRKSQDNIASGLNSNIYIYKQIMQIVNNPQSNDGDKALEDLKKYKNDCTNYYSLVNIKNVKIALPNSACNFIDNTSYYLGDAIKVSMKSPITQELNSDLLNSINQILVELLPIKTDYTSYAIIGRNKSFDEALAMIDNNKEIFYDIKNKFNNITVPVNGISLYGALSKMLNTEECYIQGFRYALDIERIRAISTSLNPKEIQQLYSGTNTLLKDLNSNYDDFLKQYIEFKDNFSVK